MRASQAGALLLFSAFSLDVLTTRSSVAAQDEDTVVIVRSASTNVPGYRIVVKRPGEAEYSAMSRGQALQPGEKQPGEKPAVKRMQAPAALIKRLFAGLDAAKPLSALPKRNCAKSASFGYTLTIEFGGEKTPDLSCWAGNDVSTDARLKALIQVADEIRSLFNPA